LKAKPTILVTNDDSIYAPGLAALVEVMIKLGNVVVVAPSEPMSGVGHAITIREPIIIKKSQQFNGIPSYMCKGTPVDCVKFGMVEVLKFKPDLVVAGINHGSNASINALYSGTISAAMEGALEGVASIGFSVTNWEETVDMKLSQIIAEKVTAAVLANPLPPGLMLNVNIPDIPMADFRGIKICRQAVSYWKEQFVEEKAPDGERAYWLRGDFVVDDARTDTDLWALENNFASIVPTQFDLTAHHAIPMLLNFEKL
jgi:5'-nucleotidase